MKKLIVVIGLGMLVLGCGNKYEGENKEVVLVSEVDKNEEKNWGNGYTHKEGKIFFGKKEVKEVDIGTFEVLKGYNNFAKDKNNVYSPESTIIREADPESYTFLNSRCYAKDKNNVYYLGFRKLKNFVDVNSFEILDSKKCIAKDKNNIYHNERKLINSDSKSFTEIGRGYYKDKNNVYYMKGMGYPSLTILEKADPLTFDVIENSYYAEDKYYIYLYGEILIDADPKTFKPLKYEYSTDKNTVYILNEKLKNSDPKTFSIINFFYSKDKNNCYKKTDVMGEFKIVPMSECDKITEN